MSSFITNLGLLRIEKTEGESANYYFKKRELLLEELNKLNKDSYVSQTQINKIYNNVQKIVSQDQLGCKYY